MDVIKIEGEPMPYQAWPAWAEGPDGQRQIFNHEQEVPAGWVHHDELRKRKEQRIAQTGGASAAATRTDGVPVSAVPPAPPAPPAPKLNADGTGTVEVDAAGVAWDPARHAQSKGKTQAGLWRMAVGKSRPANEAKPLDL